MKKLSEINERLWTTAVNRGIEGRVKKEDEITNLKNIKFIDCGCSVLWSDSNLIVDGEEYLDFDTYMNLGFILPKGYRLPTLDEFDELIKNSKSKHGIDIFKYDDNGVTIHGVKFEFGGFINANLNMENVFGDTQYGYFPSSSISSKRNDVISGLYIYKDKSSHSNFAVVTNRLASMKCKLTIRIVKEK